MTHVTRKDAAMAVACALRYWGDPATLIDHVVEIYKSVGPKPSWKRVYEDAENNNIRRDHENVVVTINNVDIVGLGAAADDLVH